MSDYALKDVHEGYAFEWSITIRPSTYPPTPRVSCPSCLGRGREMGHDYDTVECQRCHGTGAIADPSWEWKPKPPQDLVDRLKAVYMTYWNEKQNESFKLT